MTNLPLFAVVVIAIWAIVAVLWQSNRSANQVSHLLAHMAQMQTANARERYELCTRINAPQVAAAGMIARVADGMMTEST